MMNLQELETIAYHHLPIKIFLLNNQGYHSIRQTQSNFFGRPLVGCEPGTGVSFPSMEKLAKAYPPKQLEKEAFGLYEKFRPVVAEGMKGWGAKGELDLETVRSLAK